MYSVIVSENCEDEKPFCKIEDRSVSPESIQNQASTSMSALESEERSFMVSRKGSYLFYCEEGYEYRLSNAKRDKPKLNMNVISRPIPVRCNTASCTGKGTLSNGVILKNSDHNHPPRKGMLEKRHLYELATLERKQGVSTANVLRNMYERASTAALPLLASERSLRRLIQKKGTTKKPPATNSVDDTLASLGIVAPIPTGDIETQPTRKLIFNAPYDHMHTYHFKIINISSHRIAWAVTPSNLVRLAVLPDRGVLEPNEAILVQSSCNSFVYGQEDVRNDHLHIQWSNTSDSDIKLYDNNFFQSDGARSKILAVEYNL